MKKALAGTVALSLVLLSPGLQCYAQLGETADPEIPAGRVEAVSLPARLPGQLPGAPDLRDLAIPGLPEASASQAAPASRAEADAKPAARSRAEEAALARPSPEPDDGAGRTQGSLATPPFARAAAASPSFFRIHARVLAETKPWRLPLVEGARETAPDSPPPAFLGPGLRPASARGPDASPPRLVSSAPGGQAPQPPRRGGLLPRARAWLLRFYRVFPDKVRNRQFWRYNLAQVVITQGATFYSTALPGFVAPTKTLAGRMGVVRAASFGAQLGADVAMGPSVDQKKTSSFLFKTYLGRGLFLIAIPVLSLAFFRHGGLFPTLPLIGVLVGMSFLQSAGVLASNVGFNRLLGDDPAYYNKANAANSLVVNLAGVVGPALAGAFIGWATSLFGVSSGNALAFGVYGAASIVTALIYRGVGLVNRQPQSKAAGPREKISWKETLAQLKVGFQLLWRDRFLRLTLLLSTASLLIGDAIYFLALPSYLAKIGAVVVPAFIAHLPLVGHLVAALLGTSAAIFGFFFTASNLGATVFDALFISRQGKSEAARSASGKPAWLKPLLSLKDAVDAWLGRKLGADLTPLQKQGVWSSVSNGVGWVAGLSLFLTSHLWLALGAFALSSFLQSPAGMVWSSLQQDVLNRTYPRDQAKIWSAMSVYSQVFTMAGDLVFGLVMAKLATGLALGLVMAVMGICAALAVLQPFVVLRPAPIAGGPAAGPKPRP